MSNRITKLRVLNYLSTNPETTPRRVRSEVGINSYNIKIIIDELKREGHIELLPRTYVIKLKGGDNNGD